MSDRPVPAGALPPTSARHGERPPARAARGPAGLLIAVWLLSACGAEVAPAAAALATRQASQAEEGRRQVEAVQQALGEAAKAREAAASEALEAAR